MLHARDREPGEGGQAPRGRPVTGDRAAEEPDDALVCAACGHRITRESERIEMDGAHESVRVNLAGVLFRVGCFARAPGCRGVGESSTHWSWFPGFAWQVAVCAGCGEHLGWAFLGESKRFHGLLLDALRAGPGAGQRNPTG